MVTRTEEAVQALHGVLKTLPRTLPAPTRNREIATLLTAIAGGGAALNLQDGETTVDAERLGFGEGDEYELAHRAEVEWIVEHVDQPARDALFDAGLEAIADAIEADRTLGGAVSDARIESLTRSGHVTDGAPQIKAAVVTVLLTYTSPRPF